MPDELKIFVPVCRDQLREKYERIARWRAQDYEFEKVELEKECKECR